MTLTPQSIRTDVFFGNKELKCGPNSKPCGNACIPKDHECRASWNKPVRVAGTLAAGATAGLIGTALFHPREPMRRAARETLEPAMQMGFALGNVVQGNVQGAIKNVGNAALAGQNIGHNARTLGKGYGSDIRSLYNKGKEAVFKMRNHRPAQKRDSVWAQGFKP